jgi:hypothetical protein
MNFFHYLVSKFGSKSEIETTLEVIFECLMMDCGFDWNLISKVLQSKSGGTTLGEQIAKKGYSELDLKNKFCKRMSQDT